MNQRKSLVTVCAVVFIFFLNILCLLQHNILSPVSAPTTHHKVTRSFSFWPPEDASHFFMRTTQASGQSPAGWNAHHPSVLIVTVKESQNLGQPGFCMTVVTANEKGPGSPADAGAQVLTRQHCEVTSVSVLTLDRVISLFEKMTSRLDKSPVMGGSSWLTLLLSAGSTPTGSILQLRRLRAQDQVAECHPGCQWLQGHCFASSPCGQGALAWVIAFKIPPTTALVCPVLSLCWVRRPGPQ